MRPFLVEPPQGVLVPWGGGDGLAAQCSLETDDERQPMVEAFERAAVSYLDGYTGRLGRCILDQKWALPLVGSVEAVFLPFPDCRDFAIERVDDQGEWSVEDGPSVSLIDDYALLSDLPDDLDGLHLTLRAGWDSADDVPPALKQAVRMLAAHWFDNRAAVSAANPQSVPMGVEMLIDPFKQVWT